MKRPRVLAIAGLEASGKAGLLADVATIRELGGRPLAVATALTAQSASHKAVRPVSAGDIALQIRSAIERRPLHAVKMGMLPSSQSLDGAMRAFDGQLPKICVVDPVTRASDGQRLSTLRPGHYLALGRMGAVLTPNLSEAAWLLGMRPKSFNRNSARLFGRALVESGCPWVVVKGGHRKEGPDDFVAWPGGESVVEGRAVRRAGHRGTGCRFASALAVGLAQGLSKVAAVRKAKRHVERYLRAEPP